MKFLQKYLKIKMKRAKNWQKTSKAIFKGLVKKLIEDSIHQPLSKRLLVLFSRFFNI